ncbi:MAG: GntR family transcriptional regulator, partial [Hungatella sp.]
LRQEGFVKLDRRKGAVISLAIDKFQTLEEMRRDMAVVLAKGICKDVGREEVHQLVDEIYDIFLNITE